ncbi:MAG TPA: hypothetical protein VN695_13435 [Streptosporangiaceae bacterium]|nr:hypothetical protein [Streptosporangiaceae bacterium]
MAPDGSTAAVACADGRLLTVALDVPELLVSTDGEPVITEIARSANAEVADLAFSPDSRAARPHDWAAGRDPQLDTAVRLALQALEQRPPAAPPAV